MDYELMHRDVPVALIGLDDTGRLTRTRRILAKEHMPVGTCPNGIPDGNALSEWWSSRSIPASRSGIRDAMYRLGIDTTGVLLERCMGLSLSDQYWIRRAGDDTEWSAVNFFDNPFSEDMGDLLFGSPIAVGEMDPCSPDNTSDGVLRKRWKIVNGERRLIKGGSGHIMQEPFNEVIATMLMGSQGIDCCRYDMFWMGGRPYCSCPDFLDRDTELVTASRILSSASRRNDESRLSHYIRLCGEAGVDVVPSLDRMMAIDYIMANTDRHMKNFGLVRNAVTLEYLGPAPVFDTGTSLGCLLLNGEMGSVAAQACKPFAEDFESQLSMVSSLDWFDADAAMAILPDVRALLSQNGFLGGERAELVAGTLERRMQDLARRAGCPGQRM